MVFSHTNQSIPHRINDRIGISHAIVSSLVRQTFRRCALRLPINLLVGEVRKINYPSGDYIITAAVLMHARARIEFGGIDVGSSSIRPVADNYLTAALRRPHLD